VPSRERKIRERVRRDREEAAQARMGMLKQEDAGASALPIVIKGM
jgi:hypothetical protein